MSNRLTKITTKTGDKGKTSIANGQKLDKFDARIEAIGEVDELNSLLGVVYAELQEHPATKSFGSLVLSVQHDLFDLGSELAMPEHEGLKQSSLETLETHSNTLNQELAPLREFILPSGSKAVAYTHLARAVCRRAERQTVKLSSQAAIRPLLLQYLNRLSDLLFILARTISKQDGQKEILWKR